MGLQGRDGPAGYYLSNDDAVDRAVGPGQSCRAPGLGVPSLGEEFRAAREARGLSLSDVSEQIHIRATYLQAIEDEDWPTIGAPVYVRGFLRTYARFLGVDPEHAVEAFTTVVPSSPPAKQPGGPPVGVRRPGRGPSIWLWLAGAVALALLAYVGYGYYELKTGTPVAVASPIASAGADSTAAASGAPSPAESSAAVAGPSDQPSAESSAAASPTEETSPTPRPTPARAAVSIRVTEESWLRVSVDGNVVLQGTFPAGTIRDFAGKHVNVRAGNAGGVEVAAPGRPAKTLGAAGEVVERDFYLAQRAQPAQE